MGTPRVFPKNFSSRQRLSLLLIATRTDQLMALLQASYCVPPVVDFFFSRAGRLLPPEVETLYPVTWVTAYPDASKALKGAPYLESTPLDLLVSWPNLIFSEALDLVIEN